LRRIQYKLNIDNKDIIVCRKTFHSVHGITEKRVRTVLDKQTRTGSVEQDMRGQKLASRIVKALAPNRKDTVFEHINSIPTRSHKSL
jgi:hypothetical protein